MKYKTIIKLLLVILWMSVIFMFSSQSGEESSNVSDRLIIKITETIRHKKLSIEEQTTIVDKFTVIIRKVAHMSEYCLLAVLLYLFLIDIYPIDKYLYILIILLCIFYATTDEIHQLFVPDRSGTIIDVLIDTIGTLFGTSICYRLHNCKHKKLKRS